MKYYRINFTLSSKIRGNDDYVKDYKLKLPQNNLLFWEVPEFIGNVYNERIDFNPYLLDIELYANSKINDLIMEGGPVSLKLIVSGRLKSILEKHRKTGMQFFNINITKKGEIFPDYWILNMYEFNQELIDFENSQIKYEKRADDFEITYNTKMIFLSINSLKEFEEYLKIAQEKQELITIEKLILKDYLITEDFFILKNVEGGIGYFVSEKLKKEIEESGCTGIEFQPSHLSLNEWLHEEREKIYGKI